MKKSDETAALVESAAAVEEFTLVVPAINFTVRAVHGDKQVEVAAFNTYVERAIALPDHADPGRITTAVVVEHDGTVRHVPTYVGLGAQDAEEAEFIACV